MILKVSLLCCMVATAEESLPRAMDDEKLNMLLGRTKVGESKMAAESKMADSLTEVSTGSTEEEEVVFEGYKDVKKGT